LPTITTSFVIIIAGGNRRALSYHLHLERKELERENGEDYYYDYHQDDISSTTQILE